MTESVEVSNAQGVIRMSLATIDYAIDDRAVEDDREVLDATAWPDRPAKLRRPFTRYEPRHRADGAPA